MRDEDRSDYGQRLLAARTQAGLRQVDLAAKAGISQGTLADLEKQGRASKFTAQLAIACGVRPQWLASGEGPMVDSDTWPFRTVTRERLLALSPEDRAYVEGKLEAAIEGCEAATNSGTQQQTDGRVAVRRGVPAQFPGEILSTGRGSKGNAGAVSQPGELPAKRGSRRA